MCMCSHLHWRLTLNRQLLHGSALSTAVVGWQSISLDAASGTDSAAEDVVGVQVIATLCKTKAGLYLDFYMCVAD